MFHISLFEKNDGKNGGEDIANRCEKMATRAARTIREEMGDRGEALNQGGVEEGGPPVCSTLGGYIASQEC